MLPTPPSAVTPDFTHSYDRLGRFSPTSWFFTAFGELSHRETYQLITAEARQLVVDKMAEIYDLGQITVVHSTYVEEVEKPMATKVPSCITLPAPMQRC
jgi:hypothetical protein